MSSIRLAVVAYRAYLRSTNILSIRFLRAGAQSVVKGAMSTSQLPIDGKYFFFKYRTKVCTHNSLYSVPLVGEARVINIGGCPACRVSLSQQTQVQLLT